MKLTYIFPVMLLLILFCSLACVAASQNVTSDDVREDTGESIPDETDLSVNVKLHSSTGQLTPWTVTVKVNGSTAYNAKVKINLSEAVVYQSHNQSMGFYDSSTGIWDIGNLTSRDNASVIIMTKLKSSTEFSVSAFATSDTPDSNIVNNFYLIEVGIGISIGNSSGVIPSDHPGSAVPPIHEITIIIPDINDDENTAGEDEPKNEENHPDNPEVVVPGPHNATIIIFDNNDDENTGGDDESPAHEEVSNPSGGVFNMSASSVGASALKQISPEATVKKITSFSRTISNTIDSLMDSIINLFNAPVNGDSNSTVKINTHMGLIIPFDYTRFPMLVFVMSMILLAAVAGYARIKS